jgi:hypothetical protein
MRYLAAADQLVGLKKGLWPFDAVLEQEAPRYRVPAPFYPGPH